MLFLAIVAEVIVDGRVVVLPLVKFVLSDQSRHYTRLTLIGYADIRADLRVISILIRRNLRNDIEGQLIYVNCLQIRHEWKILLAKESEFYPALIILSKFLIQADF